MSTNSNLAAAIERIKHTISITVVNENDGFLKDLKTIITHIDTLQKELDKYTCRKFPVMSQGFKDIPDNIPWHWIEPFNASALRNHEQTLQRLSERGGLNPIELLAVVENRRWARMSFEEASSQMLEWIKSRQVKDAKEQEYALHLLSIL